ncbi:hypothetical protein DEU38_11940 [Rhodococcus sp. AG1013]|nr:hypothetical protein DEU38_11940 [Rhodococcus sp. AG1013]
MGVSMARRGAGLVLAAAAIAGAGAMTAAPAGAAPMAAQPGQLTVNGGGDDGMTGWIQAQPVNWVRYGSTSNYPAPNLVNSAGQVTGTFPGGISLFAGSGGYNSGHRMWQMVDTTPSAASIDAGAATANVSALLGGYLTDNDKVEINYKFLDVDGTEISSITLPPVTPAERGNATGFVRRQQSAPVPAGTRQIGVEANFSPGTDLNDTDAVVDNILLFLDAPLGNLQVTTSSDASGAVSDGQVVNYTTTFTNTGGQPVAVDQALVLSGLLDDADLVSGPTSSDAALTVSPNGGNYGVAGTVAPGQSVTVTYAVAVKPFASQGDHNLVAAVTDPAAAPAQAPASCTGIAVCAEVPTADSAAVPMVNPAVAGGAAAVVLAGGGVFWAVRRRATAS